MSDFESKLGIRPIADILEERRGLTEKLGRLRSRYGSFGTFDHLRKIEISRLHGLIRAQATRDGVKKSNDQIDAEAHAHPDYIDFVTEATNQRAEWVKAELALEELEMQFNRGQMVGRFASFEARL